MSNKILDSLPQEVMTREEFGILKPNGENATIILSRPIQF
jgi:hypothetical protein